MIDGNAILHRAYHALPPFKTPEGELVNAVYGFSSMLLHLLAGPKPEYIAVAFDRKAKTFRHEEYVEYKATRAKAPDDLYEQLPRIKEIVETFKIPIFEIDGYEADDVLATLAHQSKNNPKVATYIVTGDMDALQLVDERTFVYCPKGGFKDAMIYNEEEVFNKYGLTPAQVPDMKGLQGDNSDNLKGVPGIGPKTALTLLQEYKTLENVYENIEKIAPKVRQKLEDGMESGIMCKRLATVVKEVPVELDLSACLVHEYNQAEVAALFQKLDFKSLIGRLNAASVYYGEKNSLQGSLF